MAKKTMPRGPAWKVSQVVYASNLAVMVSHTKAMLHQALHDDMPVEFFRAALAEMVGGLPGKLQQLRHERDALARGRR